jgi:DNA-binding NarL/FixJ family response regulator
VSANSQSITVSIVEDDSEERRLFVAIINREADMRCISEHPCSAHALRHLPLAQPDVALLDIRMPRGSGIECARRLSVLLPKTRVLMLTKYVDDELIYDAFSAGAVGYLQKKDAARELPELIRTTVHDGVLIPPEIGRRILEHFRMSKARAQSEQITLREKEVLELIRQGRTSKQIAERLGCSSATVDRHAQNICAKLRVGGRSAAAHSYFK